MSLSPGTKLSHFEIQERIGAGGMGEVYRATDTTLRRDVAIKLLPEVFARDAERVSRFKREAQLLAALNHPNIATIHGLFSHLASGGQQYFLVMELVGGETLAEMIRDSGTNPSRASNGAPTAPGSQRGLPIDDALNITVQICEALEHAHEHGVIHRDLKPANVKVTPEGKVKVLDFGLAKAFAADGSGAAEASPNHSPFFTDSQSPTLTASPTIPGVILGTAAYMSPEQARGKPVDRRTDIWALGCVLFEMLTGKQAFVGEDVTDILAAVVRAEPDWSALPAATPAYARGILRRCLQKDRSKRLSSAGDLTIQLQDASANASFTGSAPAVESASPARSTLGARLGWAVAAACLIAAATVSLIHFRETPPEMLSTRFEIYPPEKSTFSGAPQVAAISPDGKKLVYQATGPSGSSLQLWVRPLDSLIAQPLPGTEATSHQQFWSRDSRSVVFYGADLKLKRANIAGGPVQTLCSLMGATNGHGSWNRDGVIVFVQAGVIARVSESGANCIPVTKLNTAEGENQHLWPHFLPDGDHFLYLAVNRNLAESMVRIGSLSSPESKPLFKATSFVEHAPPGYLLFRREDALMAQPFDEAKLEFTGEALPIVESIQVNPSNGRVAVSVSNNGVLAYRSTPYLNTQMTWFDRSGKQLGTVGEIGGNTSPKLSPDGKQVAVARMTTGGGNEDIWVYDLARNTGTRLTFDAGSDNSPLWSPDGSHILFVSNRNGHYGFYQKAANGVGQEEEAFKVNFQVTPEDWSQDGRNVLFLGTENSSRDVNLLPMTGDRKTLPYLNADFLERHSQFSPDGRWVAYTSNESGIYQVYVQSFPLGAGKWQASTRGGVQPRWRRDGKELYFISGDGKLMAVAIKPAATFEMGTPAELFPIRTYAMQPTNLYAHQYDVTADGQRFLVNQDMTSTLNEPITVVTNWTSLLKK